MSDLRMMFENWLKERNGYKGDMLQYSDELNGYVDLLIESMWCAFKAGYNSNE